MSCVMGLDLSLSSTGVVVLGLDGQLLHHTSITTKTRGMERLWYIRSQVADICTKHRPCLIAIEGYSRGARNGREEAGELAGIIKLMLFRNNVPYITPSPMQNKKFATGTGKAEKNQVMLAVFKRWGFSAKTDDEADGFSLAVIALTIKTKREPENATQREVIEAILNPPSKKKVASRKCLS